jgi:hypothetical protein
MNAQRSRSRCGQALPQLQGSKLAGETTRNETRGLLLHLSQRPLKHWEGNTAWNWA